MASGVQPSETMVVLAFDASVARLRLTTDELRVLAGAIREAKEALDDVQFRVRVGVSVLEAQSFQKELMATTVPHSLGTAIVELTSTQLLVLANAINEALLAIENWEFPIRMGTSVAQVMALHQQIRATLGSMTKLWGPLTRDEIGRRIAEQPGAPPAPLALALLRKGRRVGRSVGKLDGFLRTWAARAATVRANEHTIEGLADLLEVLRSLSADEEVEAYGFSADQPRRGGVFVFRLSNGEYLGCAVSERPQGMPEFKIVDGKLVWG